MRLFLDTANVADIREAVSWGVISGVTTNPTLVAKEGRDFHEVIREIAGLVSGPVSAEVIAQDAAGMVAEAKVLAGLAPNVVVKVPITRAGLQATKTLAELGIAVNMTLVFSVPQVLLAARAGAAFVSPFVGRLDDVGEDGLAVVRDAVSIITHYGLGTQVIAASIRHPAHVVAAARAGAHIATVPFKVLEQMLHHPLTDIGIERFLADWQQAGQKGR